MATITHHQKPDREEELANIMNRAELDVRMVTALCGDRPLNAREQDTLNRLLAERGDGLFADMLYTLTHRAFPAKQAKHIWEEITNHRKILRVKLDRDVGIAVAAHDYLTNASSLLKGVTIIEESTMASLANVATRDGLTGLFDQASFRHKLKEELERQVRYGSPISLVMFDIDHFKRINDTFGHTEGDRVLRQVSEVLRGQVRLMDTAARYGGEEFTVILPEVEEQPAFLFAERLRQNVQDAFGDEKCKITISLGTTTSHQGDNTNAEDFIRKTDDQLYRAKRGGRNRVCQGLRDGSDNPPKASTKAEK